MRRIAGSDGLVETYDYDNTRPLHNFSIRHSGLNPESRKYLRILDSRFRGNDGSGMDSGACPGLRSGIRRNDKIAGFMQLCRGLIICGTLYTMTVLSAR